MNCVDRRKQKLKTPLRNLYAVYSTYVIHISLICIAYWESACQCPSLKYMQYHYIIRHIYNLYTSFHCGCNLKSILPLPRLTRLATFRRAKISTTAWKAFLEEDRLGQTCFSTSSNSCLGGISCQKYWT